MPMIQDSCLYDNRSMSNSRQSVPFHYYWPLRWRNFPDYPYIEGWLKEWRREAVKEQETWLALQREYRDKFFKEEAKYWLRMQRACTFMLIYYGHGEYIPSTRWPRELSPELDEISSRIELREIDECL